MSLNMTKAEREAFLADVHVGVVALPEAGRGPLAAPIWYQNEPGGDLVFVTDRDSRKFRLLEAGGRLSLCAQTEAPPYRYVSVEGPFSLETPDYEKHVRQMAVRYLGAMAEGYLATRGAELDSSVLVRMRPERWLTVDYGKM